MKNDFISYVYEECWKIKIHKANSVEQFSQILEGSLRSFIWISFVQIVLTSCSFYNKVNSLKLHKCILL